MGDGRSRYDTDEWGDLLASVSPACRKLIKRALAQRDMRPAIEDLSAVESALTAERTRAEAERLRDVLREIGWHPDCELLAAEADHPYSIGVSDGHRCAATLARAALAATPHQESDDADM